MTTLLTDCTGNAMTGATAKDATAYDAALREFNSYMNDPVATIDTALAVNPDFIMGHVLKAELMISAWERSVVADVRAIRDTLLPMVDRATDRECGHIAAIDAWAAGDWRGYQSALDRVLIDNPRDLLALQAGHLSDFYHGDRDNLRGRVARALPAWSEQDPSYGHILGMQAFGLEECGDYARAEDTGRHALTLVPADGWAQHAVAHVMEMQARQPEAVAFMEDAADLWGRPGNALAVHNWWHTALFHLDQDQITGALKIYDSGVRPGSSEIQLEVIDAVAFLWRMHLRGLDVGDRWTELAALYTRSDEPGFYAFNDMHAMMAFAATGDRDGARRVLQATTAQATGTGTNADMSRRVGLAVVNGIDAFGRGVYAEAVEHLMPVRYAAHAFGGSHAQRDIIHRTVIEAALRAGQPHLATAMLQERVAIKRDCPFSWSWLARARSAEKNGGQKAA
ncbi:MAG: tetratricopeptide repeat protein [Alphaproteobacteria bacterium]|nr:tetratricopeptide repeat protein [Alphaproteobacteria bacterium]